MAYTPKFASQTAPKRAPRPTPAPENRPDPPRKRSALSTAAFFLLGVIVVPLSLGATWLISKNVLPNLGRPAAAVQEKTGDMAIMDRFDTFITNRVSDALSGVMEVKKRYWISEDAVAAPKLNQTLMGEVASAADMKDILEQAAGILEGQSTYFTVDTEIIPDTVVKYYLDDSIFAVTWKELHENCVYTVSEVKVSHPSQFRRHLAGGEYGSEMQFLTTEMAESVNAVVASSGDFYRFRDFGTSVYEGVARRVSGSKAETCYIDANGDLLFTRAGEIMDMDAAQAYVDEHNIRFSLAFGPILVEDGQRCEPTYYSVGEIDDEYARAALCQMDTLHYLVIAANREGKYVGTHTVHTFAKYVQLTGCQKAYCLDGGQTAAIVMNNQLINRVVYGYQRKISDIIYFATAIPEEG